MWLHRKKEKDDPKMSASTSAASETDGKAQTVAVEKKTPQGGIRKKILQFSSRVHHGFGNGASGTEGLSAKEIQRLEEAKKRLFQNKSPSSDRTVLSLVDGNSSPLPELRTMDNFLTHSTALWSPTGSSSGSLPSTSAGTTAAEFSYGTPKEFNVPGLSLPALAAVNIDVRELVLHRNASGDFGFKIRRMQYPIDGHHSKDPNMGSAVVFAEPCEFRSGPPRPSDLIGGLLPGDQLLEVNNKPVQSMTRDELLEEVQNSGSEIRLKVRAVPELAEFCKGDAQVEGALLHFNHGKCNDAFNESISDDERYWLIHAHGYTLCKLLAERLPDGKAKICVADGGDSLENERTLVVDSSDIDRANPARLDKIGDLAGLKFLNETSFIHLLRQRFGSNLQYTFGGTQNLVYLNAVPDTTMDEMSAEKGNTSYQIGQQNLMKMFRGCKRSRMPAHIYALAQQVYRNIQVSNRNQSVIFTGISGSGKSSQLRDLLYYLCEVSGSKIISYNKLRLNLEILEAFGNCNTLYNPNASRFIQLISLGFDTSALLCSIKIHTGLLETSRLMSKQGERPFHIFEYLWYGATQALRDRLNFHLISEPFFGNRKKDDGVDTYAMKWSNFVESLTTIGFTQAQIDGIFDILAAIFHLKHAGATQGNASRSAFINAANAENAANLLGLQFEELSQAIFRGIAPGSSTGGPSANSSISNFSMSSRSQTGQEALDSFIQSLYAELFSILANMINKQLAGRSEGVSHINILDIPGGTFSDAWDKSTNTKPGGLNELVFNYVNEKVLELFYNTNFVEPAELYAREQVQVTLDKPMANPQPLVRMLDKKQQLLNCADLERRSAEPRGLLYILEEEATFPGSNDHSLFERLFVHFEQNRLIRRHPRNRLQFVLSHSLNTAPTTYSVEGWVKQAQATNAGFIVPQVLQASQRASISELWNGVTKGLSHSASQSLIKRRTTQCIQSAEMGRSLTGFFSNISYQLEYLLNTLGRSSRHHFVHCVKAQLAMTALANGHHSRGAGDVLNVSFVRQQMRSVLLIDSVRAHNRAYPERMPFRLFRRLFHCLVGDNVNSTLDESALDDRSQVQKILEKMEIFEHRYRLGISQILLRSDVLMELEEKRDLALSGLIGSFQSRCREYLARRWLAKRRVQEIAIKCIQRNARLHFRLKKWTWWNLYTRVTPLLSVVRTDEEQRQWRERTEKLEAANTELKSVRVRLEGQVEELEQLLKTECQNTQRLSLNMESEVTTRIHLENELRALKQQLTKALARNELKEVHEDHAESLKESTSTASVSWEENEKTAELKGSLTKMREQEMALKLKHQKTTEQLQDIQAEVENLRSRNEQLEKRQKNFNNELKTIRDQSDEILLEKERLEKQCFEQNMATSRRNTEIMQLKEENAEIRNNLAKARRDLESLESTSAKGDASDNDLLNLRKLKREQETKIVELEDELEETLQKNQLLEQNITRLEMSVERSRSETQRDAESKEGEIAELRSQYQRRLRAFEDQLNDLSDANNSLIKQNRLLEARTRQLDSQSHASSMDLSSNHHYKRELRKALALWRDTQALLNHERESAPNQSLLRQLKEQLEDAEAAKLSAQKSRHSLENDLADLRSQLEMAEAAKTTAEEKVLTIMREKNAATSLVQEQDEQLQELLKKYKAQIQQSHVDAISLTDQIEQIGSLERAKQRLQEQLNEIASTMEFNKLHMVEKHKMQLLELKLRDVQAKLDLEVSHKLRLESIVVKLREEVESLQEQLIESKSVKDKELETSRRNKKETLLLQEQINELKKRETELAHKLKLSKTDNEKLIEEQHTTTGDLKLAMKRIDALQAALNADVTAGSDIEEEDENEDENREENTSSIVDEDDTSASKQL